MIRIILLAMYVLLEIDYVCCLVSVWVVDTYVTLLDIKLLNCFDKGNFE